MKRNYALLERLFPEMADHLNLSRIQGYLRIEDREAAFFAKLRLAEYQSLRETVEQQNCLCECGQSIPLPNPGPRITRKDAEHCGRVLRSVIGDDRWTLTNRRLMHLGE